MLYAHEIELNVEQERAEVLARYGSTQVEAYVATCDIAEGSKVDSTNVERRLMPGELLPEGAVTDLSQVKAQPAQARIYSGEVLLTQRFEQADGSVLQVPDGLCAVSVPAKAVSAVVDRCGWARQGERVFHFGEVDRFACGQCRGACNERINGREKRRNERCFVDNACGKAI